jgi:hypothetical protein
MSHASAAGTCTHGRSLQRDGWRSCRPDGVPGAPRAAPAEAPQPPRRHRPGLWTHGHGPLVFLNRARAIRACEEAGVEPITLHEARHCAIPGLRRLRPRSQAGPHAGRPGDIRVSLNRYGHAISGSERASVERVSAYLAGPTAARLTIRPIRPCFRAYRVPLPGFEPGFPP